MIVIVFDRLPASSLGCYGSFACKTPHFDLLAAQGVVFDHCFVNSSAGWNLPQDAGYRIDLNSQRSTEIWDHFQQWLQLQRSGIAWCLIEDSSSATADHTTLDQRLHHHFERVEAFDQVLGNLLEVIVEVNEHNPVMLTAQAGDVLAIRSELQDWRTAVGEEISHVPFILVSEGLSASRVLNLVGTRAVNELINKIRDVDAIEPEDVNKEFKAWQNELSNEPILSNTEICRSIRTSEWLAVWPLNQPNSFVESGDLSQVQLFAKPGDRWEQLNVAAQYPGMLEELSHLAGWTSV